MDACHKVTCTMNQQFTVHVEGNISIQTFAFENVSFFLLLQYKEQSTVSGCYLHCSDLHFHLTHSPTLRQEGHANPLRGCIMKDMWCKDPVDRICKR